MNRQQQRKWQFKPRPGNRQQRQNYQALKQNTSIKQRLGVRKGQNFQTGNQGGRLRMDVVSRQLQANKQFKPRQINRQQKQQISQRQITNQQFQPARKRKMVKSQQNISSNPILQVSVPNKPTKSVSIKLGPKKQPQARRQINKLLQVQVAQQRQQRKEAKQQPQQDRLISNMLAQSQREQQQLQNKVNHLQAVISDIQNTSNVKQNVRVKQNVNVQQNVNVNRAEFAKGNTGLSLNQRFSTAPSPPQVVARGGFRGGRRGRGQGRRGRQQQVHTGGGGGGQRMVFL